MVKLLHFLEMDSRALVKLARTYGPAALATAVEIMGNGKAKDSARLKAAQLVLAYGHGMPVQNVNLTGSGEGGANPAADPDAEFRDRIANAASAASQAFGAVTMAHQSAGGFAEIGAPDPARDSSTAHPLPGTYDTAAKPLDGEVLAPLPKSDLDSMPDKDRLAALAVGVAVGRGLRTL